MDGERGKSQRHKKRLPDERNDDYILTEGQHKGIVSEEVWEKAHAKRLRTGVKQP